MTSASVARWTSDERIAVARLAGLDQMTTARLRSLLLGRRPGAAVGRVLDGAVEHEPVGRLLRRDPAVAHRWRAQLAERSAARIGAELADLDVRVLGPEDPEWPPPLLVDPDPPPALFVCGRLDTTVRRVAVVGTRNPTAGGLEIAARFGHGLASAGVAVVSGLALGIDGAAHRGALAAAEASLVAVVANGHDRPYPKRHAALWREVTRHGAVVSEWPPGTAPEAHRFPRRNRIIAAMSEAVIVVESRERGGSLLTARDAAERGVEVMAVPGAPGARAAAGTNKLVQDGAALVVDVDDVLTFLQLDHSGAGRLPADPRPAPSGDEMVVLGALRDGPTTVDRLAGRLGLDLGVAAMHLARLERSGWAFEVDGWFEALDEWARLLDSAGVGEQGTPATRGDAASITPERQVNSGVGSVLGAVGAHDVCS
ncbi:MAG: DNA-processing protein DprA [Actinomycetota bacterium]